jgi:anti-sigma regulatory factor (Ser/Thr protein kinase)
MASSADVARPGIARPPVAWWARDFPGYKVQVRLVRRWIEGLLPDCEPRDNCLLLASELSANALEHTASGLGGLFSVHVEWSPELARVVVGDQGAARCVTTIAQATRPSSTDESGRGLLLVDELADDWGTALHPGGRCTWFDVRWAARGGPPLHPVVTRAGQRHDGTAAAGTTAARATVAAGLGAARP